MTDSSFTFKGKVYQPEKFLAEGGYKRTWTCGELALQYVIPGRPDILEAHKLIAKLPTHDNVARVIGVYEDGFGVIILPLYTCSLETLEIRDLEHAIELMAGIAAGLGHLHAHRWIHCDVKPENILMDGDVPRLGDFDFSLQMPEGVRSVKLRPRFTPAYAAPEVVFGESIGQPVDIWALGIMLYGATRNDFNSVPSFVDRAWEVVTSYSNKEKAWPGLEEHEIVEVPAEAEHLGELVNDMLKSTPKARPSATEVLSALQGGKGAAAGAGASAS